MIAAAAAMVSLTCDFFAGGSVLATGVSGTRGGDLDLDLEETESEEDDELLDVDTERRFLDLSAILVLRRRRSESDESSELDIDEDDLVRRRWRCLDFDLLRLLPERLREREVRR